MVGFDLVERPFDFPALMVDVGGVECGCGCEFGVGDRGDEAKQFSAAGPVFDHVLDDPDEGGLGGLEVLTGRGGGQEHLAAAAADFRVDQQGSVGAIG